MKKIDEVIYHEELENGLNVYIYKKNGFAKKGAFFVTHYGSSNNEFVPIGENDMVSFPKGIAHFLEHKIFESSDNGGNVSVSNVTFSIDKGLFLKPSNNLLEDEDYSTLIIWSIEE